MTWNSLPCECGHPPTHHDFDGRCDECDCEWYFPLHPIKEIP